HRIHSESMMRRTRCFLSGVSGWTERTIKPLVDGPVYNPKLFGKPDDSLLTRAERVFLDLNIRLVAPSRGKPRWTTRYNLHKSVDKLLMEELLDTYGKAAMRGIHVDPKSHQLVLPPKRVYTQKDLERSKEMSEISGIYHTEVFDAVDRVAF